MSYYIAGSREVTPLQLKEVSTPHPTKTHYPIPHHEFLELVTDKLQHLKFNIEEIRCGVDQFDDMHSIIKIEKPDQANGTFKNVVGVRNSHNKRFSAGLVAGASVMVCDNLSFCGEVKVARKHTRNIMQDLPGRIDEMFGTIIDNWAGQTARFNGYAATKLATNEVDQLIGTAIRRDGISPSKARKVIEEYENPKHDEFKNENAWCLFNAFTEVLKQSPTALAQRSINLHSVFDEYCEPAISYELNYTDVSEGDLDAEDYAEADKQRALEIGVHLS